MFLCTPLHAISQVWIRDQCTEYAAFAQGTGVLQDQPGVHAISVVLVVAGQHPQTLQGTHKITNPVK